MLLLICLHCFLLVLVVIRSRWRQRSQKTEKRRRRYYCCSFQNVQLTRRWNESQSQERGEECNKFTWLEFCHVILCNDSTVIKEIAWRVKECVKNKRKFLRWSCFVDPYWNDDVLWIFYFICSRGKMNISSIPAHRVQRKWIYQVSIRLEPPCLHKGSFWWHYFVYQLNRLLAHWDKW